MEDSTHAGYRGATACAVTGITYRQLDYWARTGLLVPSIRTATGSGTPRLYSFRDAAGAAGDQAPARHGCLAAERAPCRRSPSGSAGWGPVEITLMSDGASIFECTTEDEVVDIMQGWPGESSASRSDGSVPRWPARWPASRRESVEGDVVMPDGVTDELAVRRSRKTG